MSSRVLESQSLRGARLSRKAPLRLCDSATLRLHLYELLIVLALTAAAPAQPVIFTDTIPFTISGETQAAPGTPVRIFIENAKAETQVKANGRWSVFWTAPLPTGAYDARIEIGESSETQLLRVQLRGLLPRQSGIETQPRYPDPLPPEPSLQEITDRWRIVPPPYELDERSQGRFDPYNQNILKGDRPIRLRDYTPERFRDRLPFMGDDAFLVLTGISDSLVESRTLPTPSGVSADRPGSFPFFGSDDQGVFAQNVILSADVFEGDTTFQPVRQRIKITLVANLNHVHVEENAIVKPDPRRGTERTDGTGLATGAFLRAQAARSRAELRLRLFPRRHPAVRQRFPRLHLLRHQPRFPPVRQLRRPTATSTTWPSSTAWRRTPTAA